MNTMMAVAYDTMSRVSRRVRNVESEVIQNKDSSFLLFDPLSLSRISRTKKGGDEKLGAFNMTIRTWVRLRPAGPRTASGGTRVV